MLILLVVGRSCSRYLVLQYRMFLPRGRSGLAGHRKQPRGGVQWIVASESWGDDACAWAYFAHESIDVPELYPELSAELSVARYGPIDGWKHIERPDSTGFRGFTCSSSGSTTLHHDWAISWHGLDVVAATSKS